MIRRRPNICCQLHLPAQSGSSRVLESMRRGYTREAYLDLVDHVRSVIPGGGRGGGERGREREGGSRVDATWLHAGSVPRPGGPRPQRHPRWGKGERGEGERKGGGFSSRCDVATRGKRT